MQPWVNPYEECDYNQQVEEEEDLDFIYTDPNKTGESDFDEMEGEYDDPVDEISLASLFNQVTDLPCDCIVNKKEEEVIKAQADTSSWGLLMSQRGSHCTGFEDGSRVLFGEENGG